MYFVLYLVFFSPNILYLSFGHNLNIYYAQDFCQYETINNKIVLNEDHPSIIIRASRGSYKSNLDCQLRVSADENFDLIISINDINLRHKIETLNYKFRDYLNIKYNAKKAFLWYKNKLREKVSKFESFLTTNSSNNDVVIKFTSTAKIASTDDKGFELIITASKHKSQNDKSCPKYLFDCGNGECIQNKLKCNGVDNCGNKRDETFCKKSHNNNYDGFFETGFWFGFKIVISLLLIGLFIGIISCICKNCDERRKMKNNFYYQQNRYPGCPVRDPNNCAGVYSKQQTKAPLYPQLYRNYGGTEVY